MTLLVHVPIEKKQMSRTLAEKYQAWRDSGGVPTVITKETLREMGMKKQGKWSCHPIGTSVGRFVPGEKQAPMLIGGSR